MLDMVISGQKISFTGDLTIQQVEAVWDWLLVNAASQRWRVLDIKGLNRLDFAGMQLLLALLQSQTNKDQLRLEVDGDLFKRGLEISGLENQFQPFFA